MMNCFLSIVCFFVVFACSLLFLGWLHGDELGFNFYHLFLFSCSFFMITSLSCLDVRLSTIERLRGMKLGEFSRWVIVLWAVITQVTWINGS